jgi:hypothetical protein
MKISCREKVQTDRQTEQVRSSESQLTAFIQEADVKKTGGRCSRTGEQPAADRVVVVV